MVKRHITGYALCGYSLVQYHSCLFLNIYIFVLYIDGLVVKVTMHVLVMLVTA